MSAADLTLAELDAFGTRDELCDELVRRSAQRFGIEPPSWSWTKAGRGGAHSSSWSIELPSWAQLPPDVAQARGMVDLNKHTPLFLAYYVVHEVAHLPDDSWGHGPEFKQYERDGLAELGLGIRYMRHYPRTLIDLETGEELYVSLEEHARRMRLARQRERRSRAAELLAAGVQPTQAGYVWRNGRPRRVELFNGEWLPVE